MKYADILNKLRKYCAYQERCHQDVERKLCSIKDLPDVWVDDIIAELISENYLNEERFAELYAGSKFRTKGWGKHKIRFELKKKEISDYLIDKSLSTISDQEYLDQINKWVEKKSKELSAMSYHQRKSYLYKFLFTKGYGSDEIQRFLDNNTQI